MTNLDLALEQLPKVELHCHIEGTMRPTTVLELAHRNNVPLRTTNLDELYRYTSLTSFLEVFWMVQAVLVTREDWARLGYESVVDSAAHGRVYSETFFTPAAHLKRGQDLGDIIAGLAEGIAAAEGETGARCMLICDIDRDHGPSAALEMVERLVELRRASAAGVDRVLGVGMDSTELGVDPRTFAPAYKAAASGGFRLTAHQGENSPASAIRDCLDVLGAQRIDHGLSLPDDPDLVRRFAGEQIPLTMCPNSNILIANRFTNLADHPFSVLRAQGVLAMLNSDDPALMGIDLGYEYRTVAAAYGWDWDEMVKVARDGVAASWLDDDDKRHLDARITAAAEVLRPTV
jgi:adenosine deaminase